MRKTLFAILLCGVMALGLTGCGKSSVEDAKKDLQEYLYQKRWKN